MNGFRTTGLYAIIGVLSLAAMFIAGCSGANRGGLRNSREVGRAFETFHVYPNHTYYYQGVENNTKALAGLQEPYRIAGLRLDHGGSQL